MFRPWRWSGRARSRDAEADARLAFEHKLPVSPPAAMLWCLSFLVDALVEADDLAGADTVLTGAPAGRAAGRRARRAVAAAGPGPAAAGPAPARRTRWPTPAWPRPATAELGVCHPVFAELARRGGRGAGRARRRDAGPAAGRPSRRRSASGSGTPGARGAALRVLARTSADPIPLLEQAVQTLACSPARLEHTRALVALGRALRRANRRADAGRPLRRALEQADRGGMLLLAGRAREELHAIGARPRRSALSGPGALTPAEHRVGQLAARGTRQPRDRRAAVRDAAHRRDAPHARVPEAGHPLARRARRRAAAADSGLRPGPRMTVSRPGTHRTLPGNQHCRW